MRHTKSEADLLARKGDVKGLVALCRLLLAENDRLRDRLVGCTKRLMFDGASSEGEMELSGD